MEPYYHNDTCRHKCCLLLVFFCFGAANFLVGQDKVHAINTSKIAATLQPAEGKERYKDYISSFRDQLDAVFSYENKELAISLIEEKIAGCSNTDDLVSCQAGIYFAGAYRFHAEAEIDPEHEQVYMENAEHYYKASLSIKPEYPSAQNNLVLLNIARGNIDTAIIILHQMAETYPDDRIKNLIHIGDLYLEKKELKLACEIFNQAYAEDPFSSEACLRVTNMYLLHRSECFTLEQQVHQTVSRISALSIQFNEAGLPNYAEQLLRQQIIYAISENKTDLVVEGFLLWTKVLLDNQWLVPRRLEDLVKGISEKSKPGNAAAEKANTILRDLIMIAKGITPQEFPQGGFWHSYSPSILLEGNKKIAPRLIFLDMLRYKGRQALEAGDVFNAEAIWQEALNRGEYEDTRVTKIAQDIAQLYAAHPEIDPGSKKMQETIDRLFNGKMIAYISNNKEMIREFHTVLGGIFYSQKKWEGGGKYANAKFQLEHALDKDLGPIVNPELRIMLGETYEHIAKGETKAIDAFQDGIMDMLLLDRVEEAGDLAKKTGKLAGMIKDTARILRAEAFSRIIEIRKSCADPKSIKEGDSLVVNRFVGMWAKETKRSARYFTDHFFSNQYFKCLSDLGNMLRDHDIKLEQKAYAEALLKITEVDTLYSANDFKRMQNIKRSLDQSVDRPYLTKTAQWNVKTKYSSSSNNPANDKVIQVTTLGKEIRIPQSMIQLSTNVKQYYSTEQVREIPRYEYKSSEFQIKSLHNTNQFNQQGVQKVNDQQGTKPDVNKSKLENPKKVNPKTDLQGGDKGNGKPLHKLNKKQVE